MKPQSDLFPLLESVGFDVDEGVRLCGGDSQFYSELIQELHSDVLSRRHRALTDPRERKDYAHLLKGTLQTLGEGSTSIKARRLEQTIREGAPGENLAAELLSDLDRIDSVLGQVFENS